MSTPRIIGPCPEILYQDEQLLFINKPANLLSVPGRGEDKQDCVSARVQAVFPDALIVHRLDYDTSGILLMALGKASQSALGKQFQQREVNKLYTAIVHGKPAENAGTIDLAMRADIDNRPRQILDDKQGKSALTHWQVIETCADNTSRLQLRPHTGRSHQLRVHMKAIGHPIVGDNLYGTTATATLESRLMLHATKLQINQPVTGKRLTIINNPDF